MEDFDALVCNVIEHGPQEEEEDEEEDPGPGVASHPARAETLTLEQARGDDDEEKEEEEEETIASPPVETETQKGAMMTRRPPKRKLRMQRSLSLQTLPRDGGGVLAVTSLGSGGVVTRQKRQRSRQQQPQEQCGSLSALLLIRLSFYTLALYTAWTSPWTVLSIGGSAWLVALVVSVCRSSNNRSRRSPP